MMTVNNIITRVKAVIDELMAVDTPLIDGYDDGKNLTDIIKYQIPYAYDYCVRNASNELITGMGGTKTSPTVSYDGQLVGKIKLGQNVLRVVGARLSSWTFSPMPVSERSEVALMQTDPYARGSYDRPVVVVGHDGTTLALWLYSARSSADTADVWVIERQSTINDSTTSVNIPDVLESAFIYELAGLVTLSFREDISKDLLAVAERYLGRIPVTQQQ